MKRWLWGSLLSVAMASPLMAGEVCQHGIYGAADKQFVVISSKADGTPIYTFVDGRHDKANTAGAPVRCEGDKVSVSDDHGAFQSWPRLAYRETPMHFTSHGAKLSGMLIEPPDRQHKHALVVFVHGSERSSAMGFYYPYTLAALGLTVVVYDKRGTGSSEGEYTQNFELLADDAVAALDEGRRVAKGSYSRAGYFGGSQGGWVAPLAARRSHADFVAVGFGLVLSPQEEDQEQVAEELSEAGASAEVKAKAREVTDATGAVIASHFSSGYDTLEGVKRKYGSEAWFGSIHGEYTGKLLHESEFDLRRVGAALYDTVGLIWNYDALSSLQQVQVPQLWVLAGDDREAPGSLTEERLKRLISDGKPIDVYVFPHTDHGIYEFVQNPDGTRKYTRIADGYFQLLGDWIKQTPGVSYGHAIKMN